MSSEDSTSSRLEQKLQRARDAVSHDEAAAASDASPRRPTAADFGGGSFARWRANLHEIIFEADTAAGKAFDVALLVLIALSVIAVCLESVESIRELHGTFLRRVEWISTALFTLEYLLRLLTVLRPIRYAVSFFGLVDLLAILPSYISLLVPGTQTLLVIRGLRLLRIVRVFKLARFLGEARILLTAVRSSARKVTLFVGSVLTIVLIMGALMYLIEGPENGFTSIPRAMYWGIVTVTTVGYGDISPKTTLGQFLASALMVIGWGMIAVPSGILSVELLEAGREVTTQACPACSAEGHDADARHCKFCGAAL